MKVRQKNIEKYDRDGAVDKMDFEQALGQRQAIADYQSAVKIGKV